MSLDPARAVRDLEQLRSLTGDESGAQRVCWTETWARARSWYREQLAELPVDVETDEAGNLWATLAGESERSVLIGGHLDSVPNGGWLDGCLNVIGGLEVLRDLAARDRRPVTVRLVDWADEEGARFGRSLFGSSACAGSMHDQETLKGLRDRDGVPLSEALAAHGVDVDRASAAGRQLANAAAYLELHIEQGPVLESLGLPLAAVLGTFGVERHRVVFTGQAAHAGSTPMDQRRDALAGAARFGLELREIATRTGGGAVSTMGSVTAEPGIVTAVAERATCLIDQRHLDASVLATMLAEAKRASEAIAAQERLEVSWERTWSIEPIRFDETLIQLCAEAIEEVGAQAHRMPSGPLHDAAEVSRAGVPTVMLFVQSLRGLSHTKLEDTRLDHLELCVRALGALADRTIAWVAAGGGRPAAT